MSPYDLAHQLAKALSLCNEYREFKEVHELVEKDLQAKEMLEDLRKKQLEVETMRLSGKDVAEELKSLENLYNIVSFNSVLQKYLLAEQRFAVLMMDIQKILAKAVDLDMES